MRRCLFKAGCRKCIMRPKLESPRQKFLHLIITICMFCLVLGSFEVSSHQALHLLCFHQYFVFLTRSSKASAILELHATMGCHQCMTLSCQMDFTFKSFSLLKRVSFLFQISHVVRTGRSKLRLTILLLLMLSLRGPFSIFQHRNHD